MKTKKKYIQPQAFQVIVEDLCGSETLVKGSIHKQTINGTKVDEFPIKTQTVTKDEYSQLWNDNSQWGND